MSSTRYPGNGSYNVICDVCGIKLRAKDAIKITDRYNHLNNMIVCRKDADKTNPQERLGTIKPRTEKPVQFSRPENETATYVYAGTADEIENPASSASNGRQAGSPQHLTVIGATASSVELEWYGPDNAGSSPASGYVIQRESPVGGGFSTLATLTQAALYYKDTSVSASTQYNYRVAIINDSGTGDYSSSAAITTNSE